LPEGYWISPSRERQVLAKVWREVQAQQELSGLLRKLRPAAAGEYVARRSRQTGIEAGYATQGERHLVSEVFESL